MEGLGLNLTFLYLSTTQCGYLAIFPITQKLRENNFSNLRNSKTAICDSFRGSELGFVVDLCIFYKAELSKIKFQRI